MAINNLCVLWSRFTDGEPVKTFSCEYKSPWTPTSVVPDCVSEGMINTPFFIALLQG